MQDCCNGNLPWPLLAIGPPGTGKTCAALALLDRLPVLQGRGWYFTAAGLGEAAADAMMGRYTLDDRPFSASSLWEGLARSRLVVLDELGARERVTDHHYDCVKRLLDVREGMPLVAMSNADLPHLTRVYDDRVASRLAAGTVVRLEGVDRRLERENAPASS